MAVNFFFCCRLNDAIRIRDTFECGPFFATSSHSIHGLMWSTIDDHELMTRIEWISNSIHVLVYTYMHSQFSQRDWYFGLTQWHGTELVASHYTNWSSPQNVQTVSLDVCCRLSKATCVYILHAYECIYNSWHDEGYFVCHMLISTCTRHKYTGLAYSSIHCLQIGSPLA